MDISSKDIFKQPYNSSWIWKSILSSKATILDHLKWSVGNGVSIPINHHLWWPMQSGSHSQDSYLRVADLLLHSRFSWNPIQWNSSLVRSLYSPQDAAKILATPISLSNSDDFLSWHGSPTGTYTARKGFQLLFSSVGTLSWNAFWELLWSLNMPMKNLLFIWKLMH